MRENLGIVEKKVLGALLILSDHGMVSTDSHKAIARVMGYKRGGGAITYALRMLEINNYITKTETGFKVLL